MLSKLFVYSSMLDSVWRCCRWHNLYFTFISGLCSRMWYSYSCQWFPASSNHSWSYTWEHSGHMHWLLCRFWKGKVFFKLLRRVNVCRTSEYGVSDDDEVWKTEKCCRTGIRWCTGHFVFSHILFNFDTSRKRIIIQIWV